MQLSEQWVLVTGGARGLGQAITRAVAREGAGVVINYHRSDAAPRRWPTSWARAPSRCRPM